MSLEEAFAKALAARPDSRVAARVRKAIRHSRANPGPARGALDTRELQNLGYRFRQLGRRWASFRLSGCSWVGPIEQLRSEWRSLREALAPDRSGEERAALLQQLALGIGPYDEGLDRPGRSYLLRVVETLPGEQATLCRLEGVRLFSPVTLLVEAIHDLAGHSLEERQALRDFLDCAQVRDGPGGPATIQQVCRALARWLQEPAQIVANR